MKSILNNFREISPVEVIALVAILLVVILLERILSRYISRSDTKHMKKISRYVCPLLFPVIMSVFLAVSIVIFDAFKIERHLHTPLLELMLAWIVVRILLLFMKRSTTLWITLVIVIPVVLLHIFEVWEPFVSLLQSLSFSLGKLEISLFDLIKFGLVISILFSLSKMFSEIGSNQLKKVSTLDTGSRLLIIKVIKITLYSVSALLALNIIGVELTMLTVFGGALGVGIGFGLQKIASNFISGLILLMEKSIRVGDMVELTDGVFGFVRRISARYTLVETLENKEIMIPNEDFITQRVTNWTYSDTSGRADIPIGVSYNSDIEKAQQLILEAANEVRNPKAREPECFLREFGDSSVNFLLFFWINDVREGRYRQVNNVMMKIWKKFKENGIEIPFPQRDVHVKGRVQLEAEKLKDK